MKLIMERWNKYLLKEEQVTAADDIEAAAASGAKAANSDPTSTEKVAQVVQSSGEEPAEVIQNAEEVLRKLQDASSMAMEGNPREVTIMMDKPLKGLSDKERNQHVGNLIKAMGGGPALLAGIMGGMFVGLPALGALTVGGLTAALVSYIGKSMHDWNPASLPDAVFGTHQ